jgi:acyl-coenzyme A thioesterase PaaI-like protein
MGITTFFRAEALTTEAKTNFIRDVWDRLEGIPGGKRLFSRLVGRMAPYTGTIGAVVQELGEGYARVTLTDRHAVRNHLSCIHAVALANLVELTGNLALGYSLPDDARFIVAGMGLDYLKKARGTITGECRIPAINSSAKQEYQIKVTLRDESGERVVEGTLPTVATSLPPSVPVAVFVPVSVPAPARRWWSATRRRFGSVPALRLSLGLSP